MEPHLCIGIDVGCKAHRVGIATPDGSILEEFDISHTDAGFQEFFRRVEERRQQLTLPVAVAMEGYNGYARPLDRLVQEKGYRLFNVNNLKLARFESGDTYPNSQGSALSTISYELWSCRYSLAFCLPCAAVGFFP